MEPQEYRHMFELEDRYWWFLGKRELVRMLVGQYGPEATRRIVDVGCGTGGVSAALFADAPGWVGMDFSPIALELCRERGLTAIINIHDVLLAQMFAERIVGLRLGEVVYDGPPDGLTPAVLTEIYGEEDWEATIETADVDEDETLNLQAS